MLLFFYGSIPGVPIWLHVVLLALSLITQLLPYMMYGRKLVSVELSFSVCLARVGDIRISCANLRLHVCGHVQEQEHTEPVQADGSAAVESSSKRSNLRWTASVVSVALTVVTFIVVRICLLFSESR
jgi:hypothetical protein